MCIVYLRGYIHSRDFTLVCMTILMMMYYAKFETYRQFISDICNLIVVQVELEVYKMYSFDQKQQFNQ